MKQPNEPTLTALERELLGYVRELTLASEASAKALQDLENNTAKLINKKIGSITKAVDQIAASQIELVTGLQDFLNESQDYDEIDQRLSNSLEQVYNAEQSLKNL